MGKEVGGRANAEKSKKPILEYLEANPYAPIHKIAEAVGRRGDAVADTLLILSREGRVEAIPFYLGGGWKVRSVVLMEG